MLYNFSASLITQDSPSDERSCYGSVEASFDPDVGQGHDQIPGQSQGHDQIPGQSQGQDQGQSQGQDHYYEEVNTRRQSWDDFERRPYTKTFLVLNSSRSVCQVGPKKH